MKEHVVFTKISFFNVFSILMHFISFFIKKKKKKKKKGKRKKKKIFAKLISREIFEMTLFAKICPAKSLKFDYLRKLVLAKYRKNSFTKISSRENQFP